MGAVTTGWLDVLVPPPPPQPTASSDVPTATSVALRTAVPELDLADDLRRGSRGDDAAWEALRHDRICPDHAALADLDSSGDDAVGPEPAVGADPHRAAGDEALLGDRPRAVVVAVIGVPDEAAVGEHGVVADLDQLHGGEHDVAVEIAIAPDRDSRLGREGQPAAGLEVCPLPHAQPAGVQALKHLALDGMAYVRPRVDHVLIDSRLSLGRVRALVPVALCLPELLAAQVVHHAQLSMFRVCGETRSRPSRY